MTRQSVLPREARLSARLRPARSSLLLCSLQRDGEPTEKLVFVRARECAQERRRIVDGDPWRRILEIAAQVDADLIVLGGHRHHGVERVLGTVASRVVNHADRNVLVVRQSGPPLSERR